MGKNRERWRRRIPATPVTGSEGGVGELEKENEPHPLVPVARWERVGGGRSAVDSEMAAEALVGGGTPVALGGEGRVGEHRWECGMLVGGLIWAEQDCSGGSAASWAAAELGYDGEGAPVEV